MFEEALLELSDCCREGFLPLLSAAADVPCDDSCPLSGGFEFCRRRLGDTDFADGDVLLRLGSLSTKYPPACSKGPWVGERIGKN